MGPISKAELKQAFARGQVGSVTPCWAAGMAEPQPLASIRELRWLVSRNLGTAPPPSPPPRPCNDDPPPTSRRCLVKLLCYLSYCSCQLLCLAPRTGQLLFALSP